MSDEPFYTPGKRPTVKPRSRQRRSNLRTRDAATSRKVGPNDSHFGMEGRLDRCLVGNNHTVRLELPSRRDSRRVFPWHSDPLRGTSVARALCRMSRMRLPGELT